MTSANICNYDFLVIGGGIAGLSFALKAAKNGSVAIVTKAMLAESNSGYAQGGVAAVIDETDNFESHINDTLIAGDGLSKREAVELIVKQAPKCINELIEIGTVFTINEKGKLDLGREGGHSRNRIVHATDLTGSEIIRALTQAVKKKENIKIFEHHQAIDLIIDKENNRCNGATILDVNHQKIDIFLAKATLLATGGAGQVYEYTTNPKFATGDGFAIAYRAGAQMANMEFVQFHPTALFNLADNPNFLITEAVRGAGAYLLNTNGERFMTKYHQQLELAPRDIVARSINTEMENTHSTFVYLDARHIDKHVLINHFPNVYKKCLSIGFDMTKDLIPVVPAAHYFCGGVVTDLNAETNISGLYASGEVACTGVHGANRLASNSLLEALVFSDRAAKDAVKYLNREIGTNILPTSNVDDSSFIEEQERNSILKQVRNIMSEKVGIVRSNQSLIEAQTALEQLIKKANNLSLYNTRAIDAKNIIQTAWLVVASALQRKESRGGHFNKDFPQKNNDYLCDTIVQKYAW